MINRLENFLISADKACDYIPAVSSASNLIDIFQKSSYYSIFK